MNTCRKCGIGRMSGPIYNRGTDRLVYHCQTCGYTESRPTADKRCDGRPIGELIEEAMQRQQNAMRPRR